MANPLRLYHLGLSPNGKRARLALGLKGLEHELVNVDPHKRDPVIEASGQPLTPVLLHGEAAVFDSWAIVRYLDANFRTEPRLFAADRETMKGIEAWESFARTRLGPPLGAMFGQVITGETDEAALKDAARAYGEALEELERALGERGDGFLLGPSPTAADVGCAALLNVAWLTPGAVEAFPIIEVFHRHLAEAPGSPTLRRWYARLDAADRFRLPQNLPAE